MKNTRKKRNKYFYYQNRRKEMNMTEVTGMKIRTLMRNSALTRVSGNMVSEVLGDTKIYDLA